MKLNLGELFKENGEPFKLKRVRRKKEQRFGFVTETGRVLIASMVPAPGVGYTLEDDWYYESNDSERVDFGGERFDIDRAVAFEL